MNWRRLVSSMGSSPEPAVPAYGRVRVHRKRPAVLGIDLNRSDTGWTRSLPAKSAHGSGVSRRTPYSGGGSSKANRCGGVASVAGVGGRVAGVGEGWRGSTLFGSRHTRHTATPGIGCGWRRSWHRPRVAPRPKASQTEIEGPPPRENPRGTTFRALEVEHYEVEP
jgi:hypothetical protein